MSHKNAKKLAKKHTELHRYGFNGKENDRTSWSSAQLVQDYGMRLYNPAIGKFLSVDPLSKKYPFYTPYAFAGNTPISAIDLDGLETWNVVSSPTPVHGPFEDEKAAEKGALVQNNVPELMSVESHLTYENIKQTGYSANKDMTPILTIDVTTVNNESIRFVGLGGTQGVSLDIDVDGSGGRHGAQRKPDPNTSIKDNGKSINGDNILATTVPQTLIKSYGVEYRNLAIITGPDRYSRKQKATPTLVADGSGDHGGELFVKAARFFKYATRNRKGGGPDSAGDDGNDRKPEYTNWYVTNTQLKTSNKDIIKESIIPMGLLYQAREKLSNPYGDYSEFTKLKRH